MGEMNELQRQQPRSAELVAGVAALLAGVTGLLMCLWLYHLFGASKPRETPIYAGGALVSLYSLVVASRLLRRDSNRRYLFSHWVLVGMGAFMAFGAVVPAIFLHEWSYLLEGLALGWAAIALGWRRMRGEDAA